MPVLICTKDNPYTKERENEADGFVHWRHDNTREIGEQMSHPYGGDTVKMECLNCGHKWHNELPQ